MNKIENHKTEKWQEWATHLKSNLIFQNQIVTFILHGGIGHSLASAAQVPSKHKYPPEEHIQALELFWHPPFGHYNMLLVNWITSTSFQLEFAQQDTHHTLHIHPDFQHNHLQDT